MTRWIEVQRIPVDETFSYRDAKAIVNAAESLGYRAEAQAGAIVIREQVCVPEHGRTQAA
jgi:hypothetical protein